MGDIHVATFNVDGLRNPQKRTKLFQYFLNFPYDVILLQETHVQQPDIQQWQKEWPSYSIWNPGESSQTCGSGILINGKKNLPVTDYKKDQKGRIISIIVQYN